MIGNFLAILNFKWLFLKLSVSFVTNCRLSPIIDEYPQYYLNKKGKACKARVNE